MDLSNLTPAEGSVRKRKRVGRGQGSGRGGTSTKGHKGAQSRTGYSRKPGFEGGQMPIQRRLPKGGFKNPFRVEYIALNLGKIQALTDKYKFKEITPEVLHANNLIGKTDRIKVLANGELKAGVTVKAHAFSAAAIAAIEAAGGTAETI
ncbi:MAG: 50S ribosomal protein L15 [Flavobacteriales bacterium]|nr:50S ribosomal protein L15 [Bacteroidota bacterium]MCB9241127.1 50S ribosomal protein L15 [Flavobacteriales bacterium]